MKSSSINTEDSEDDAVSPFLSDDHTVRTNWKEYLLDVAFQTRVLRHAIPGFEVKPWLWVVNKGHPVTANETLGNFNVTRNKQNPKDRPKVVYSGDLTALRKSKLLALRDVTVETNLLMPEVEAKADALAALLDSKGKVRRVQVSIAENYKTCRICEYRLSRGDASIPNGFAECWGKMATIEPHILDLHRVGQIGSSKFPDPVPALLESGKASLLDLAEDQLGKAGSIQERRHLQWSHSKKGDQECLPEALKREIRSHQKNPGWPLHFVDFEACDISLPHHAGLRPYERVAFQWSCHTLVNPDTWQHSEWLNTDRQFPNFKFAAALRDKIGEKGTIYVWSPYEQTTLKRVLTQIEEWMKRDKSEALRVSGLKSLADLNELAAWLDRILGPADENESRHSPRIRDLHKLALKYYFHPEMLGRTSIKVVLPAVWRQSASLRAHPWFAEYKQLDEKGQPLDPYKTLPKLPLGVAGGAEQSITDGTGAIRFYQDLIFRQESDPTTRKNRERLLKQYCRLDTAAMVMIWKHWIGQ